MLTLRARMTLLFAVAFLVAGAVLTGVLYALLTVQLNAEPSVTMAVDPPAEGLPPSTELGPAVEPLDETVVDRIRAAEERQREETLRGFLLRSLAALFVVGAAAAALGYLVTRRALRPIARITETARRVADRSLHERIGLRGPRDEVTELADTFDGMLDRLDRSFASQRAFVGNASHELRTPLAVQRTLIEVALDDPAATPQLRALGADLLATNERSERLVQGLLLLARSEHLPVPDEVIDLRPVVDHELAIREDALQRHGIRLRSSLSTAEVAGSATLLGQMAGNLLANAIKHNLDAAGEVDVDLSCETTEVVLTVTNTGRLISDPDCARIFDPFVRLAEERTGDGHGLGLAIVRSVVHAHGGAVSARPRSGGGLTVEVRLPRATEPTES